MTIDPLIAPVLQHLQRQPQPVAIEAAYLLLRLVTHGLTRERFLAQADAELTLPYQRQALSLAMQLVSLIEAQERVDIQLLSGKRRAAYATHLTHAILNADDAVDHIKPEQIDAELRELSLLA
jgi:hypothetical protein